MTDSVFDVALEKRFTDSSEIATIDVTSADTLLIRDSTTGVIMRLPFSTLTSAISSAFASSFASLIDGKVPASQLPSYVDDVLEYANTGTFPAIGETGKIYVALDTNKTYRWSGSSYVEISQSLALGETSLTAYRGDRGKSAYDHSQLTSGNPHGTTKSDIGLSNVENKSSSTIRSELTSSNVTTALGYTPVQQGTSFSGIDVLGTGVGKFNWDGGQYVQLFELSGFTPLFTQYSWTGGGGNYYATRITNESGDIMLKTADVVAPGSHTFATKVKIKRTGGIVVPSMSSEPVSPENGECYYDSSLNKLRIYENGIWKEI